MHTQCCPIKHSIYSKYSDLLGTYSKVDSCEAGFQNWKDKEKKEVTKRSGGHGNSPVYLHGNSPMYLHGNGKEAGLGEG